MICWAASSEVHDDMQEESKLPAQHHLGRCNQRISCRADVWLDLSCAHMTH
jgi:hypothetical protein